MSTSLYDASQGRSGGGNINAVLKSGTSSFHGDLWEYFRNTDLDADDYFLGKFVSAEHFRRRFWRPGRLQRTLWLFLRQLPGHPPTQWRFAGNLHQHGNTSIADCQARVSCVCSYPRRCLQHSGE